METIQRCPECGAEVQEGQTCQENFYQMLGWESEQPANWAVHHLTVLCYHLQHPSLYSPEGLRAGFTLLTDFLERGTTPTEVRKQRGAQADSGARTWKIKGTPESHGAYDPPVVWSMTTNQVIAAGIDNYCDSVRAWASSMLISLKTSDHISPQ